MDFDYTRESLLTLLNFIVLSVHCVGVYLLYCLLKGNRGIVMHVYVLNMSLGVIVTSMLCLVIHALRYVREIREHSVYNGTALASTRMYINNTTTASNISTSSIQEDGTISNVIDYLDLTIQTGMAFVIYACISSIAVDKALEIKLGEQYDIFKYTKKGGRVVCCIWIAGLLQCSFAILSYGAFCLQRERLTYYHVVLNASFICIVVASYVFVLYRHHVSRGQQSIPYELSIAHQLIYNEENILDSFRYSQDTSTSSGVSKDTTCSRYFVPALLTFTFILFTIIPDLLWCSFDIIYLRRMNEARQQAKVGTTIAYHLSFLCYALIYIFLDSRVKGMFMKRAHQLRLSMVFKDIPSYPKLMLTETDFDPTYFMVTSI